MNYVGSIYTKFHEVLKKQDGLSVGEKLYSIQKETGIDFIFTSDQDIFEAMERYIGHPVEEDEQMTEKEFSNWVESKFQNNKI